MRKDKPLAIRNGLKIYKTLKSKTKMKVISKKQLAKLKTWSEVVREKIADQKNLCQWCGAYGTRYGFPNQLTGHHIIKRRYNIHTKVNCYICHWHCHQEIEAHNIDVRMFPNKSAWENEVGH